jgi:hypothetical protein
VQRILIAVVLLFVGVVSAAAQEEPYPVEYVRVCTGFDGQEYGPGFFYIPGTEDCYRPSDGKYYYNDYDRENDTVTRREGPTRLEARELEAEAAAAIANAMEDPDLVEGERFGVRLNWGSTETADALAFTGAILLGDNLADGGGRLIGTAGLGFADDVVGARFSFQLNW